MDYAKEMHNIWEFGRFLFGNLADFYLGIWQIFIWKLGRFSNISAILQIVALISYCL